jgi:uncharacterized membrane protein YGL010W
VRVLPELLASYGRYHRDRRNRLTHFVGVPLIVYALLTGAALVVVPLPVVGVTTLDRVLVVLAALAYLGLDVALGLGLAIALALLAGAAEATATLGTTSAAVLAGVVFVLGWVIQFLGHFIEGNRPALFTNLAQIFVAPLFLAAELTFALGGRRALAASVRERIDPLPPSGTVSAPPHGSSSTRE